MTSCGDTNRGFALGFVASWRFQTLKPGTSGDRSATRGSDRFHGILGRKKEFCASDETWGREMQRCWIKFLAASIFREAETYR